MNDLALVIAAVALTAAFCLVVFYFHSSGRRRQLERVRTQRNRWYTEARELRADRPAVHRTLAGHAVADDRYWPVDRTAYLPVFDGDNPAVREYAQVAAAARQIRGRS